MQSGASALLSLVTAPFGLLPLPKAPSRGPGAGSFDPSEDIPVEMPPSSALGAQPGDSSNAARVDFNRGGLGEFGFEPSDEFANGVVSPVNFARGDLPPDFDDDPMEDYAPEGIPVDPLRAEEGWEEPMSPGAGTAATSVSADTSDFGGVMPGERERVAFGSESAANKWFWQWA